MHNLHFKYAKAENFICFGPEGIELNFEKFGNIILVRGRICDLKTDDDEDEEVRRASNGSGKSSLPEILTYTLYGKTIKKPKKIGHRDVINNQVGKKLRTEVIWDKYRVIRTRKPDSLRLWESEQGLWDDSTEITLGGMPATQKLIEERVGLSYEAFVNVVVFTDDSNTAFLECNAEEKRQIVENLLSLEKYRIYSDNARRMLRESKERIKVLCKEYDLLLHEKETCEKRAMQVQQQEKDWKVQRVEDIKRLLNQAKTKKELLAKTDEGAALVKYNEAQERIQAINEEVPVWENKLQKANDFLSKAGENLSKLRESHHATALETQTHRQLIKRLKAEVAEKEQAVRELQGKDGMCPWCYGPVDPRNYQHVVDHARKAQEEARQQIAEIEPALLAAQEKYVKLQGYIDKIQGSIEEGEEKQQTIQATLRSLRNEHHACSQIREPKANSAQLLLEQQITDLKQQAVAKKTELEGPSPFANILLTAQNDIEDRTAACSTKKREIQIEEESQPYYDYWIKAFGDTGIRKFVIDGIIPALNSRIAYWLQFLIDNKIVLQFDNELEEVIHRNPEDGNPFVYHMLSKGQRQRLNLSVSQAFAYVMMLNSGTSPSVVFLDEVTTNIDPLGVEGIYNMICELAKEKQVFVTTHDHDLLALLNGCQTINLEMRNGVTTLA